MNLKDMQIIELLILQSSIIEELKEREVLRTKNNPIGDYTEWLVSKGLGLELTNNSALGYDGTDSKGTRVQIKGRRITPGNNSRQLSSIRQYEKNHFDQLAAVIFDKNYEVLDAVLIPHDVVGEYATYREHVNAHILRLKGPILKDPRVKCIKNQIIR